MALHIFDLLLFDDDVRRLRCHGLEIGRGDTRDWLVLLHHPGQVCERAFAVVGDAWVTRRGGQMLVMTG